MLNSYTSPLANHSRWTSVLIWIDAVWLGELDDRLGQCKLPYKALVQEALKSPWFTRRWVIQEYCLTPYHSRYMLQGHKLWPAPDLVNVWTKELEDHWNLPSRRRAGPLEHDDFDHHGSTSLIYNLHFYGGMLCSDEHDIVYSLLALSGAAADAQSVIVDYTRSVEDIFVDVATGVLLYGPAALHDLCTLLALAASRVGGHDLPSWVPDWRRTPKVYGVGRTEAIAKLMNYYGKTFYDTKVVHDHMSRGPPRGMHKETSAYGRVQRKVMESWRVLKGRYLIGRARIVKPCFPWQRIDDPHSDESSCLSCKLLSKWKELDAEARSRMEALVQHGESFLILPYGTFIFVVQRTNNPQPEFPKSALAYRLVEVLGFSPAWLLRLVTFEFQVSSMFECHELEHVVLV